MHQDLQNELPSENVGARMPSEAVPPTRTDSMAQQASTQPGNGNRQHHDESKASGKVPWRDEVLGYAKVTRGKVLGKKDAEDAGHKILQGEVVPKETHKS